MKIILLKKIINILQIMFLTSICTASFVKKVDIIGNKHTKKHIILRELQHPIPAKFDSILAKQDRDRIYNLDLFSTVKIYQNDSSYTISLIEAIRTLPIPIIDYDEGGGLSYGAGIAFLNFRGLNEKLVFGGTLGNENIYFFEFFNPWLFGDHGSITSELYKFSSTSNIYNFELQKEGFELGSGFHYNNKHKYNFTLGVELFTMKVDNNFNYEKINIIKKETYYNYIATQFEYKYDTRDIYIDPTKGNRFKLIWKPKLGINNTQNRMSIYLSHSKYIELNKNLINPILIIKSQLLLKYSKKLPLFEMEYIGGEEYIRGYSPIIQENPSKIKNNIEGSQILYNSIQIQHTLINRKDYYRFETGVDIVYFVDYGIASNTIDSFQISNLIVGYGIGFKLFLSGMGTINFDFGFNPYGSWFFHPSGGNY